MPPGTPGHAHGTAWRRGTRSTPVWPAPGGAFGPHHAHRPDGRRSLDLRLGTGPSPASSIYQHRVELSWRLVLSAGRHVSKLPCDMACSRPGHTSNVGRSLPAVVAELRTGSTGSEFAGAVSAGRYAAGRHGTRRHFWDSAALATAAASLSAGPGSALPSITETIACPSAFATSGYCDTAGLDFLTLLRF